MLIVIDKEILGNRRRENQDISFQYLATVRTCNWNPKWLVFCRMKTVIIMPAYQAERTLEDTLSAIPESCFDEIILVDDASTDGTVELAKKQG